MIASSLRIRFVAGAIAVLALFSPARAQDLSTKFNEYLNAASQLGFSGSVLVARDGQVVFSKGAGLANLELDVVNTAQTKFRIGSVTKQFTAAAILLLQERGKLSVSDPVCKFLSSCPAGWKEITLRHLLSHTSGIPNFTDLDGYVENAHAPVTNESMIARFKDLPLDFQPMQGWKYSNSGYFLLGAVIEKASGESYENYLRQNIFVPLKMSNSGFDRHEYVLKQRATGYSLKDDAPINSEYLDMTQPGGAGSLYSTVEDMFLWNEALYGGKLLQPKSLEQMMTPVKNDYCYGLVSGTALSRKTIGHDGGINGFSSFIIRFLDDRLTVVVLRNRDYGAPPPPRVALDLAAIALGEKYEVPHPHVEIRVDPKILDTYVGEYELNPGLILTVARSAKGLTVQLTGQPAFDMFAETENSFFLKVVEAQLTFVKNDKGKVVELILKQGAEQRAPRVK